jgi:DNA-binding beta-propeller fold protein YncE
MTGNSGDIAPSYQLGCCHMKPCSLNLASAFCLPFLFSIASAQAAAPLTAEAPIVIPQTSGSFDFLQIDEVNHRLLAAHTGNNSLDVFDLADGKLIKSVPTGKCQDVGVDTAAGKYYVSVSKEKKVVVIDSKSFAKTAEIKLEGEADAAVFNPKNSCFYVGHDDAKDLWVVDMKKNAVTATIAIPEGPEIVVYDAATDRLFQNIKSNDSMVVIDAKTNTIQATWPTAPATRPHGMVLNPKTNHLLCAGANGKMVTIDATSGKVINAVDIASGVDQVAFDPTSQRAYAASSKGEISVVQDEAAGAKSLGNVKSNPGAKTIACDPATHAVWIAYGEGKTSYVRRFLSK